MIHVVAFSGGKDSTALLCLLREQGLEYQAIFCDTGWESPETYEYIEKINQSLLGGRLIRLKSTRYDGMVELVQIKKRVPSIRARFCTYELKVKPMVQWIAQQNDEVTVYQGHRAEESPVRSRLPEREWSEDFDAWLVRPLLHWNTEQVFEILRRHGVEPNPLYRAGAGRIGCFPCVLITHGELRRLSETRPEIWDRIAMLERAAGGRSFSHQIIFPKNINPAETRKPGHLFRPWKMFASIFSRKIKHGCSASLGKSALASTTFASRENRE